MGSGSKAILTSRNATVARVVSIWQTETSRLRLLNSSISILSQLRNYSVDTYSGQEPALIPVSL